MTDLPSGRKARTKIIATIGPACCTPDALRELVETGVDVFRINTAHGSRAEHQAAFDAVRQVSQQVGRQVGVLVDLAGPKIRLGQLVEDPTHCLGDSQLHFLRGDHSTAADEFTTSYDRLVDELSVGDYVMLADGTVSLVVESKDQHRATCRVAAAGVVRSRQGVNLPGVALSVPAMTDADLDNARWAAAVGADFVGLSFVRSPDEVRQLKELVAAQGSTALVIAKIEKAEALDCLQEIVLEADGIMVARGDLGVEIDVAQTPVVQKRIVALCRSLARPVIVATQMLDSMQNSPRPTRAEVSDVANAILDGADACMLSGETAIGQFPREAVEMMHRVMRSTEANLAEAATDSLPIADLSGVHPITAATVYGANQVAARLQAALIVIASRSGDTARVQAKFQHPTPVVGVSDSPETLRRMCLFWGITPLAGAEVGDGPRLREFIDDWGRAQGLLATGDRVIYVTGTDVVANAHNMVAVQEVE